MDFYKGIEVTFDGINWYPGKTTLLGNYWFITRDSYNPSRSVYVIDPSINEYKGIQVHGGRNCRLRQKGDTSIEALSREELVRECKRLREESNNLIEKNKTIEKMKHLKDELDEKRKEFKNAVLPKYISWTWKTMPIAVKLKHRRTTKLQLFNCPGKDDDYNQGWYDDLLNDWEQLDGSPAGQEIK